MTKPYALRVVQDTDTALRNLLRDRNMAERELASIDAQMLAYRRSYARERGEFLLPSLPRLRRELLGE
jgi:5-methylcytosine-specific restriction endonuclease McrBC regulatory subunit McrC